MPIEQSFGLPHRSRVCSCHHDGREAFKVLREAGLVEMTVGAGGGTSIISDAIPTELLSKALETSQQHLLDLSETRIIIELSAVELAASRATRKQIEEIRNVIEELKVLELDYEKWQISWQRKSLTAEKNIAPSISNFTK